MQDGGMEEAKLVFRTEALRRVQTDFHEREPYCKVTVKPLPSYFIEYANLPGGGVSVSAKAFLVKGWLID
jgi:hypothetical protein